MLTMSAVAEFAKVLESERECALRADIEGLTAIQAEKQALLDQLLQSGAPETETARLREKALANVQLIRHLVVCLQGLCAPASPTYTAGGGRLAGAISRSWGRR
jgi:hypothetical protein